MYCSSTTRRGGGGGGGGAGAEPAYLTSYNDIVRTRDNASDIETIYYLWRRVKLHASPM